MMDGVLQLISPTTALQIVRCELAHQIEHGPMYLPDQIQLISIRNVQIEAHVIALLENVHVSVVLLEQLAKEINAQMIALGMVFV